MNQHNLGMNGAVADVLRGRARRSLVTQAELAERSGLSVPSVQRYLAAKRAIDVEVLERLARALDTTVQSVVLEAAELMAGKR